MSCKFEYKGKVHTEGELLNILSNDKKFIKNNYPKQYYKGKAYKKEEIEEFDKKAAQLQKSMNVEIVYNEDIDEAQVLGKNHEMTKKAGKPVIMVNPNILFRETAIHEFGHIFIDSLPNGINNIRIKRAYEQLKGTPLEAEIRELYPNLSEEMFIKELITTAIGREGADIWDNKDYITRWEVFKDWFLGFLNRTFGIPRDEIKAMANEILSGKKNKNDLLAGLSVENQKLAAPAGQENNSSKSKENISELEQTYRGLLARIHNAMEEYKPRDTASKKAEREAQAIGPTKFSRVQEANKELLELYKTDQKIGLYKYIDWVENELSELEKNLETSKDDSDYLSNANIVNMARWDYAFETVDDIQSLIVSLERDGDITEKEAKDFSDKMRKVQGRRTTVSKEVLNIQRKRYVNFLAIHDNEVEQEYIRKYTKDYKDLGIKNSGKTLGEYIFENLKADEFEIKGETRKRIELRALELDYDLDRMALNLYSEKDADSKDIQILSKVVDSTDNEIRSFSDSQSGIFNKSFKNFLEENSSNNMEERYRGMYYLSDSGQYYYASKYKADFIEKMNELEGDIFRAQEGEMYQDVKIEIGKNGELYYKIGEGKKKRLNLGSKKKIKIEYSEGSNHIFLEKNGERESHTVAEAIAMSELNKWTYANTTKTPKGNYVISDKWLNEDYANLSSSKMAELAFLKTKVFESEKLNGGKSKLSKTKYGATFSKLPTMTKTATQKVTSGDVSRGVKEAIESVGKVKADESFEYESQEAKSGIKFKIGVATDISNTIQQGVPVKFRGKLEDPRDQSLDLHTITLTNLVASKEHSEKKSLEKTFLIVLDVMKNRKVKDVAGNQRKEKYHKNVKITNANGDEVQPSVYKNRNDREYNDVLKAMDILERRIYGVKSKYAGEVLGKDVNKLTNSWLKYAGMTSLIGNIPNSIVNYTAGTIQIYIEALGGEHFNLKNYRRGRRKYWKDMKNILTDIGNNVDVSRTNVMMNALNVTGENKILQSNFENQNKIKSSFNMSNLRPVAKGGEHMMHALTMYAVMDSIKVMGPMGKFINKKGQIVKTEKEAASIDEMIEIKVDEKTGEIKMTLDPRVHSTTFSRNSKQKDILLETRNLIKSKVRDMQGNYDPEIAAAAQKHFLGKLLFFLRKWMIPAYQRRWKGFSEMNKEFGEANQFYDQDLKGHKEGYYVTSVRFFKKVLIPAIKKMEWQLIIKGKEEMSAMEVANIRKMLAELSFIALTWISYTLLDMNGDDDDEDTLWAKYVLRRQYSELSSILNPVEAIKIASTPTASIGMLKRITQVLYQTLEPFEEYQQGSKKGTNKLKVKTLKIIPGFSQTQKDIKDAHNFLLRMSF